MALVLLLFLFLSTAKFALTLNPYYHLNRSEHKYCNSLTNCLDYAMNVIHNSDRYSLFESLWFDAINGTNHSYVITTSDPKNFSELAKKATDLFSTHYLIWKIAPGLNVKVFKKNEDKFGMSVVKDVYPPKSEGRTFGIGKRRIMMAMLPIMFKLGVIVTLLVLLTVLTLKGLTIGVILLMLSFAGIASKVKGHHYEGSKKDVHVHVHPFGHKGHHHYADYSTWHRDGAGSEGLEDEYAPSTTAPAPWNYIPPFMNLR